MEQIMKIDITREYYNDGELYSEIPHHKGKRHGIAKWWYDNGQLHYETTYHEGQWYGVDKAWWDNGQLMYETPYHEGQRHGVSKYWLKDGQPSRSEYFIYDKEVTKEEYQAQNPTTNPSNEVVCTCGKTADVGCPCWWCGNKN